jgi:hypothetical protein
LKNLGRPFEIVLVSEGLLSLGLSYKFRKYLVETCFSGFFAHAQRVMALKALIASLAKKEEGWFIFRAQPEK